MIIRWSYKAQKQQDSAADYILNRKKAYRSIVLTKKNKLVYMIENDCICVNALWDTRREPKNQANRLK